MTSTLDEAGNEGMVGHCPKETAGELLCIGETLANISGKKETTAGIFF